MSLHAQWATPEDFATLFQYFWHRDFPTDSKHSAARTADWTIHIGVVVRSIADLMGLFARFEPGKRDAVLRSTKGDDEVALEWEWAGVEGNELKKLKDPEGYWGWVEGEFRKGRRLRYAVLVTYAEMANVPKAYAHVEKEWLGAPWPLLLILIEWVRSRFFLSGREFKNLRMSVLDPIRPRDIRKVPASPWQVAGSRWSENLPASTAGQPESREGEGTQE